MLCFIRPFNFFSSSSYAQLKIDIFQCFQSHMMDADIENVSRAQFLIVDCLGLIMKDAINKPLAHTPEIVQTHSRKHKANDAQGYFYI
jgi:hypothetical protein